MNWKKLIQDLLDAGMTQVSIGEAIGKPQSSVSDLFTKSVQEPRYNTGEKLIALHKRVVKKSA